ncbi:MAG: replication protein P [Rhodocyclaceae bacterium]|nr:replication protein P [Rhodocyclaceae bacterium]
MQTTSSLSQNQWLEPHPRLDGLALIDHLFNRLDGLYPHRWRSAFPSDQAIANWRIAWAEGLAAAGVTPDEVKRGLFVCANRHPWPPSLAEFIQACRPPIDAESAYREAVEQLHLRREGRDRWSQPAIYWAAARIGNDLIAHPYPAIRKRWEEALSKALEEQRNGALPEVPPARPTLPAPSQTTPDRERARQWIARCRAILERPRAA